MRIAAGSMRKSTMVAVVLAVAGMGVAGAQAPAAGPAGITVGHGWTRLTTAAGQTTPAYLTIRNGGRQPDTLVSATCPVAHRTVLLDATGKPEGAVAIRPGQTVRLSPAGQHLMLERNRFRFYAHAMIPCSVDFVNAGRMIVYLHVEPANARSYRPVRRPVVKN